MKILYCRLYKYIFLIRIKLAIYFHVHEVYIFYIEYTLQISEFFSNLHVCFYVSPNSLLKIYLMIAKILE